MERILQTVDQLNEQCKINQWPYQMEISASTLQIHTGKRKIFQRKKEIETIELGMIERIAYIKNKLLLLLFLSICDK